MIKLRNLFCFIFYSHNSLFLVPVFCYQFLVSMSWALVLVNHPSTVVEHISKTSELLCCDVFVMTAMGASDSSDSNHAQTTSSSSWSRVNGWSWPPHPFQLIAWAMLVYIALFFYLSTIPALVVDIQIACYAVSLLVIFMRLQKLYMVPHKRLSIFNAILCKVCLVCTDCVMKLCEPAVQ